MKFIKSLFGWFLVPNDWKPLKPLSEYPEGYDEEEDDAK